MMSVNLTPFFLTRIPPKKKPNMDANTATTFTT